MKVCITGLMLILCVACAKVPYTAETQAIDQGSLPSPNVAAEIPHLGPCTDATDRTIRFNGNYPLTILVHGCNGSAGRFRSLAQLYAFHGQQAVCFSYDDRDNLADVANRLAESIAAFSKLTQNRSISILGHSMGGLVARKTMEDRQANPLINTSLNISLATVSAPLAGIKKAETCGSIPWHWLSLGIVPVTCWMATGENWSQITPTSDFILRPRPLLPNVQRYLKIVTDETNTCRRTNSAGTCIESDYTFSVPEQYNPIVDAYPRLTNIEINAGHVEIVGYKNVAPRKLISILQQQGLLAPTPASRTGTFEHLLAELY